MKERRPKLPPAFEKALLAYLKGTYLKKGRPDSPWNPRDIEYFSRGIVLLNRSFTETRSVKAFNYFNDPILRSGYLAYFLPVNAMKTYGILSRFHDIDVTQKHIKVADIGAGPLTLSFGLLFRLADELSKNPQARFDVRIDAFEQNKKIIADGRAILTQYLHAAGFGERLTVNVRGLTGSFHTHLKGGGGYDFLLLGNILNEFDERNDQARLVTGILDRMAVPGAIALFIEPGSKKFTRDLQHVRDEVIARTDFRALSPCLHQETCALNLTAKSDWCNATQPWEAPQFIRDFDEITELKKSYLVYSYLLMANVGDEKAPRYSKQEFVAISDLMKEKGRVEAIGCGPAGRVRFILSNRDLADGNADFTRIHRGSRFTVHDYPDNDEYALDKNVSVKLKTRVDVK